MKNIIINIKIFFLLYLVMISFCSSKPYIKKIKSINNLFRNNNNNMNRILEDKTIDNIDNKIFEIGKPLFVDQLIYPILGIIESIFISKMSGLDKLAVQTIGDQIFGIFLNLFSFIPPILLPLVSKISDKDHKKDKSLVDLSFISIVISLIMGISVAFLVIANVKLILYSGVLISNDKISDNIKENLESYCMIRFLSFPVCLYCGVLYTILKGNMNIELLVKSNFICNLVYMISSPFLIKYYGLQGINLLCLLIEITKSIIFSYNLYNVIGIQNLVRYFISVYMKPRLFFIRLVNKFYYYVNNGIFIQIKNLVRKTTYMKINTKILSLDNNGKLLGMHIMLCKLYELFYIFFKTLNSVSTVLIPKSINNTNFSFVTTKSRINYWINKFGLYQFSICLLNVLFIMVLKNKVFLENRLVINTLSLLFGVNDMNSIVPFLDTIGKTILFTNLNCYINGLIGFYEILLQSNNIYKIHSIISMIFSIIMFFIIPYYNNLQIVWFSSLLLSCLKFLIIKYYSKRFF